MTILVAENVPSRAGNHASNSCRMSLYHPGHFHHARPYRNTHEARSPMTTARIFKPAKNAMQSGTAKTKEWQLDFEPEQPSVIEPLMGWTSSSDMKPDLSLRLHTKEKAVAHCERERFPYHMLQ